VIAVKAGADVFERQLPYEDAPVAQAAAGRVLDEWPDAEIVAVLVDAAIRENGARTDIFDVKVEHRKEGGGGSLQRYRVEGGASSSSGGPRRLPSASCSRGAARGRPRSLLTALAPRP
jgi:hypothetical protein